jgi:hypothetical protein
MFHTRRRCFEPCIAGTACAVLVLMFSADVRAAQSCPKFPEPIKSGFRAYQFKGAAPAVLEWTYKSSFADPNEMERLVGELNVFHNSYGDVKTYHTVGVDRVTPNTTIYYVGAGLERGELFFKMVYYCETDEWILSARPQINPDPDLIFSQDYYLRLIKELEEAGSKKGK